MNMEEAMAGCARVRVFMSADWSLSATDRCARRGFSIEGGIRQGWAGSGGWAGGGDKTRPRTRPSVRARERLSAPPYSPPPAALATLSHLSRGRRRHRPHFTCSEWVVVMELLLVVVVVVLGFFFFGGGALPGKSKACCPPPCPCVCSKGEETGSACV